MKDNESYIRMLLPAQDPDGKHIMSALVKRTYDIGPDGACTPSEEQDQLLGPDVYYDNKDPVTGSCYLESDYVPFKLATDLVVLAKAHAPNGRPVRVMEVSVSIGNVIKKILVVGNRKCSYSRLGPLFSEPEPFTEMDIRWENAYGGVDVVSFGPDGPMPYPRNMIGKGFVVKNIKEAVDGLELPNLEDPQKPLTAETIIVDKMEQWQKQPMPQGFGWYSKICYPRCSFAGVLPAYMNMQDELQEAMIGAVPKDQVEQFKKMKLPMLDFRFFNGAPPGMALPYLKGDETVKLTNLDPRGTVDVRLPGVTPKIGIDLGDGIKEPEVLLQTVCILKEQNKMYLVWRGAIEYAGPEDTSAITAMDVYVEE